MNEHHHSERIYTTLMLQKQRILFCAANVAGLLGTLCFSAAAMAADSGQRTHAQVVIEPAVDDSTGDTVFLHMPVNASTPNNTDKAALLYLPLYPLSSTVTASDLNCQPNNCDHVNVLPFHFSGYDALAGSSLACQHFNGGQDCSLVKGHDHLIGVASTGGDFSTAWHVQLVVFTSKAFADGAINTRVKTLDQLNKLIANQEAMVVDTLIVFRGSITSERTYENATPVIIPFP